MALLRRLIGRTVVLVLASIYGVAVLLKLLVETVKLGPATVFSKKKRNKPPPCLQDPDLGTHGYAHLEEIRMHYISNGGEDKPLMLLAHGFFEFWYSWRYQLKEFKDKYRVVAVDLRGYGDTDQPPGKDNYTVIKMANDLKQVVIALGYEQCVLVGHDGGGIISWVFAEMYPDMVSRLIVMNCPNRQAFRKHIKKSFTQFRKSWYAFFFQLPWLPELSFEFDDFRALDLLLRSKVMGVRSGYLTDADMEAYKFCYTRTSVKGAINFYRASFSLATTSRDQKPARSGGHGGVTMPTLIIWGDQDAALDKPLAQLSSELCRNKVAIKYIEGASHWVQMDRPDLVNKHIRQFLDED